MWHRIAGRIGCDVEQAKEEVSSTQFLRWVQTFEDEWNEPTPLFYYLAQIAYQVYLARHMLGGDPKKTLDDFLIPFKFTELSKDEKLSDRDKELADIRESQIAWMSGISAQTGTAMNNEVGPEARLRQQPRPESEGQSVG